MHSGNLLSYVRLTITITVLGPILFLIYINDLPDCVRYSTTGLFADDCIIYRPIKSIEDTQLLQEDINAIAK